MRFFIQLACLLLSACTAIQALTSDNEEARLLENDEEDDVESIIDGTAFVKQCKKYYFLSHDLYTYHEAKEYCEHNDAHLALPTSDSENHAAYKASHPPPCHNKGNGCWLGIVFEHGDWTSSEDGHTISYFNWRQTQPSPSSELCVVYHDNYGCKSPDAGEWDNYPCEKKYRALCETWYPPYCYPTKTSNLRFCKGIIKKCKEYGIYLKWCSVECPGDDHWDKGCKCKGACGYSCEEACDRDNSCFWNDEEEVCYNKATDEPGKDPEECALNCNEP
jgi:hypothetical protein